jgi:predicted RecA/RadA family phage recombinase
MAALTADKQREMKDPGNIRRLKMVASKTIYQGSLVSIVGASGLAQASSDTASDIFAGIAVEQVTSAATGTYWVKVYTSGCFRIAASSVEEADGGHHVVVLDDQTVTDAAGATNDIPVGIAVERVSDSDWWVEIRPFAAAAASTVAA